MKQTNTACPEHVERHRLLNCQSSASGVAMQNIGDESQHLSPDSCQFKELFHPDVVEWSIRGQYDSGASTA